MNSTYAEQVLAAAQALPKSYLFLFSITFLYWDHTLTLSDEVLFFWRRPVGASTVLFFLNRYFAALGNIAVAVSLFSGDFTESLWTVPYLPRTPARCDASHNLQ
ncbi:hypothetical protein GYMLUDRAFT_382709 [Collybiopsis luxurians FD-317 M1]|nr:hypothetical protein GYMLUDRAFT_382709 [Collybiopsis luxurians FD-317 M1]